MSILTNNQYNFGVDKYKLLSSTAGVGAVISTKTGNYVLISSINKWPFIVKAIDIVKQERENNMATLLDETTKRLKHELGLSPIDDTRFVDFLKLSEDLSELLLLLPIPEMELNDFFNTPNWKEHPIKKMIPGADKRDYKVQATHFPKWFIGKDNKLQTLKDWKDDWMKLVNENSNVNTHHFAPPRDSQNIIKKNVRRKKDSDGNYEIMDIYNELIQSNLALICDHGHLMDIPWSKYINITNTGNAPTNLDDISNCCGNPVLKWTESSNKSEGFENVFVECTSCGKKKNLGGINSFKCLCKGHQPWQMKIDGGFNEYRNMPYESCSHENIQGENERGVMHVSLVTANRMYYATGKNSLYIPIEIKPEGFESQEILKALRFCETRYNRVLKRNKSLKKENWFEDKVDEDFLIEDAGLSEDKVDKKLINQLKTAFIRNEEDEDIDIEYDEENYRLFEFSCFANNPEINEIGLRFKNVTIPKKLSLYFTSVKQISELKVTQIQLSFNRNRPRVAYRDRDGEIRYSANAQRPFEGEDNKQFVLPAVQNYGEGIFFQFKEESLIQLARDTRFQKMLNRNLNPDDQGYATWELLNRCGQKYFIIHTFSHLIMRQLEFACGYPTASLKERLYVSSEGKEFMAGVLIYTTDGSEGSMGGLVSQASESNIENLIKQALLRGVDCSSDPLCWESTGQGLFDYNLAACFSCSLVSETACEESNLGLDRRILVDENFGFFKDLIY